MRLMKEINELHSFDVIREIEVEKTTEKKKDGETIKVTKKVKEKVPVRVFLKKPTRKEREEAEMFYSIYVSQCVRRGLLTRAMLMHKYQDSGGEVSEEEAKYFNGLYLEAVQKENDIYRLTLEDKDANKKKIDDLTSDLVRIRRSLVDFQTSRSLLYRDTAEAKAESRVILWLLLFLTYYRENEEGEIKPLFEGFDFDEKLEIYDELVESGDDFYDEVIDKMTTYVTLLYLGSAKNQDDFARFDKQFKEEAEPPKEE